MAHVARVLAVEFVVLFIAALLVAALSLVDWDIEPMADQMMACVVIGFLYPQFVIDVKRGHDRCIPLWVTATYYVAIILRYALIQIWVVAKIPIAEPVFHPPRSFHLQ